MKFRLLTPVFMAAACLANGDLRVLEAVKRRDSKAVTSLIRQRADINAAQPDGATALAWAAHLGSGEAADLLLAAGANVNTADEYGDTPLTLACANGDAVLVNKLLKSGADAKAARWNGETALMIAAGAGSVDAVKQLIAAGADVNAAESRKGQTALMWAAAEGHPSVTEALIGQRANVNAASKGGWTALVFAAVKNDAKSVRMLLAAGADPNYALPDGAKALIVAASHNGTAAAAELVDGGADPNVTDRAGNAPIHMAARVGDVALVNKLLAKGANPNVLTPKSSDGGRRGAPPGEQTSLMIAARSNRVEVMRALIAVGADSKLKAGDGSTLLMSAAASGHLAPVQYAYEFDQDVKATTFSRSTVIHTAVTGTLQQSTQDEICRVIQFLADQGAPLDEKDARGRTPIDVADVLPIDKAVELLTKLILKSGATPKSPSKR